MKLVLFCFLTMLSTSLTEAQQKVVRNWGWFTPSRADQINGIAIGPILSEGVFGKPQVINGIGLSFIGVGILLPLMPDGPDSGWTNVKTTDSLFQAETIRHLNQDEGSTINGFTISLTGSLIHRVNGISMSGFFGMTAFSQGVIIHPVLNLSGMSNGVNISLLNIGHAHTGVQLGIYNQSKKTVGVQVGFINNTHFLTGLQLGLWNKNRKRNLPLINWCGRD